MRTDRPTLSKEAAGVAERAVLDSFGIDYVRKGERAIPFQENKSHNLGDVLFSLPLASCLQ